MNDVAAAEGHIQTFYYVLAIVIAIGGLVAAYCRKLQNKIEKNAADLTAFKLSVATDYVAATRFEVARAEIMTAINRLTDALIFHRQHPAE